MKEDLRGLVMRADVFGMLRAIEVGPATFCVTAGLTIARDKPMSIRTGLIQLISLRDSGQGSGIRHQRWCEVSIVDHANRFSDRLGSSDP